MLAEYPEGRSPIAPAPLGADACAVMEMEARRPVRECEGCKPHVIAQNPNTGVIS